MNIFNSLSDLIIRMKPWGLNLAYIFIKFIGMSSIRHFIMCSSTDGTCLF